MLARQLERLLLVLGGDGIGDALVLGPGVRRPLEDPHRVHPLDEVRQASQLGREDRIVGGLAEQLVERGVQLGERGELEPGDGTEPGADVSLEDYRKKGYPKAAIINFLCLQGWALDSSGNYVNTGNLSALSAVRVGELTGTATATTRLQMRANLQSTTALYTGVYAAGDMATGTVTPHFSRSLDVYDAQGGPHRLTLSFLKTDPNGWVAEIYAEPASDVTAANGLLASGVVAFNPDGSLDVANSSPALFGTLSVTWTNSAGSDPIQLELGSQNGLDGLTQFGSSSAMISSIVNGGLLGNIASVEVSKQGVLSAIFEDGTSRALYQLPLATFPNPDGLTRLPGNGYATSDASGSASLNEPTVLGAGAIASGALEGSTVDLAGEFTNMIRFQRAYSAASRIITTVDDMLQEVSNLKR